MPVHVPADNLLIARLLLRDEKKTYGLGVSDQEILVLDSNEDSGNFELHSIESKPGDIVGSRKGARKIKQLIIEESLFRRMRLILTKRSWR